MQFDSTHTKCDTLQCSLSNSTRFKLNESSSTSLTNNVCGLCFVFVCRCRYTLRSLIMMLLIFLCFWVFFQAFISDCELSRDTQIHKKKDRSAMEWKCWLLTFLFFVLFCEYFYISLEWLSIWESSRLSILKRNK